MMSRIWSIQHADHSQDACCILAFLLVEFARLFGCDIMFNENCLVYNDPKADCPMLITSDNLHLRLRLAQPSFSYWAQTVFQLSHEMCHYAFRQRKINKEFTLCWFEEIVCEAVSLFSLEYATNNWRHCRLATCSPGYSESLNAYLENERTKPYTDEFKQCNTIEKLAAYEQQRIAEERRETHLLERNAIYDQLSNNPLELKFVVNYTQYVGVNGVVIDFDRWIQDNPCKLLQRLKAIQPV